MFWMMIHPFAEFWRGRRRNPYGLLVPLWIGLWIVVALVTAPWRHLGLYFLAMTPFPLTWLPAVALFAIGIWIYRRAGVGFSWSQLGGLPEIRDPGTAGRPLATTGIRARVRHPVYLGHLCETLAWSLGSGLAVCWGLTALAIATGAAMILMEDRELEQRYGADYRRYKENVPAIFPRQTPYNPN
jgi:protein-S-isoprenylcysteine O-methyltransferase Ste14